MRMSRRQFIDGFNKGDTKSAFAACDISIIDEFAPHLWTGPNATITKHYDVATDIAADILRSLASEEYPR